MAVQTSIATWNPALKHVEQATRSGDYVNGARIMVFAGPPRLGDISAIARGDYLGVDRGITTREVGADAFYPIGFVEAFSVDQMQSIQKFFELGSDRSFQGRGRVSVVSNMSRVVFRGPNLLRVLYSYYPTTINMANGKQIGKDESDSVSAVVLTAASKTSAYGYPEIWSAPGAFMAPKANGMPPDAFFINLMSDLFAHPFGLGFLMRDTSNNNVGAGYMEDAMITTHSFRVDSGSAIVMEGVGVSADACIGIEFNTGIFAPSFNLGAAA
jgi:hypothetical protein